ncbi:MAG TPA: CBS domain-containing protein [Bacillota bacterium]|nr:CBS domain-containing protein [Bacillota bacterium]HOL09302.1 CBS domain-containing protein [Bacillota bacterium]HPO98549.1 CBS domain-containing protein [Bacillota bacterium]
MNIAFFLLPKKEVVYLKLKSTMRQALEKMDHHGYTAVPIIDEHGRYVGTLSEGDLLRMMKENPSLSFVDTEKVFLKDIPRRSNDKAVRIDAEIEDLLSLAVVQNFIPVVDDNGIFIGIIRRSVIIEYYANMQKPQQKINS